MRRRDFLALVGGMAAVAPAAAFAQRPAPLVGFLHSASPDYFAPFNTAFRDGLAELGFTDGQTMAIEYRWAEGHYDRLPALARDLLARRVSVIFAAGGTDPANAAKAATSTMPIVFVSAADPLRAGLVASLGRPGGNVTGISLLASALSAKNLELLHQLVPAVVTVGALLNPDYPDFAAQMDTVRAAAARIGLGVNAVPARTEAQIEVAFAGMARDRVGAVVVGNDPFFGVHRAQLVMLANRYAVPVMHWQREFVLEGGLMSYGPQFADGYRQGGGYVGRVLKGESPADMPVLQPTRFELVINLRTAKALGLDVSPSLMAGADELIE